MTRFWLLNTLLIFLLSPLLNKLQARIETSSWADITVNIKNMVPLYKLSNWEITSSYGLAKVNLPLYAADHDSLTLSNIFDFPTDSIESDYIFKSNGFHGVIKIFINENLVFESPNGSAPFQIKLSKNILKISDNTISILLTKSHNLVNSFPVFTKIFTEPEYLGIIRPFYLYPANQKLVKDFGYSIKNTNSEIEVTYTYDLDKSSINATQKKDGISFYEFITDEKGKRVSEKAINFSESHEKIERSIIIDQKYIWSPENPVLLNFNLSVLRFGQPVATESLPIAFRNISAIDKTIYINERAGQIRGINYYENIISARQYPVLSEVNRQLKTLKDKGFNAVRFVSHIPDESFLQTADSIGLLVFIDMPIKRYPVSAFKQDNLLENLKNTVTKTVEEYGHHPSLAALGLGTEILLSDPASQKFFLILNGSLKRSTPFLTYLSAVPQGNLSLDKVADFYLLDIYEAIHNSKKIITASNIPFSLAGKAAISSSYNYLNSSDVNFTINRKKLISNEIYSLTKELGYQGGFFESFMDWKSSNKTHQSLENNNFDITNGLYDSTFTEHDWVRELNSPVWDYYYLVDLNVIQKDKSTNIFSIVMFFISLLFFFFYRRYPRLSENYRRSLKHPYGFYVDLRERRIIPVFNSFTTGVHNSLILTIFVGSFIYYYNNSFFAEELLLTLFPAAIYQYILELSQSVWSIIASLFLLIAFYPVYIGFIVKLYSILSRRSIRIRQALAVGLWSGSPIIFLLPFSIAAYHFIIRDYYNEILIYIFCIVIIWIQFRLINGIRVLLLSKFQSIFILLLLSYSVPIVIFFLLFDHQPMWTDYLVTLIYSHYLF